MGPGNEKYVLMNVVSVRELSQKARTQTIPCSLLPPRRLCMLLQQTQASSHLAAGSKIWGKKHNLF